MPTHDCQVTCEEHAERSKRIMEEAFGSVGIKPTIKVTAFNQEAQDACWGDSGTSVDKQKPVCISI